MLDKHEYDELNEVLMKLSTVLITEYGGKASITDLKKHLTDEECRLCAILTALIRVGEEDEEPESSFAPLKTYADGAGLVIGDHVLKAMTTEVLRKFSDGCWKVLEKAEKDEWTFSLGAQDMSLEFFQVLTHLKQSMAVRVVNAEAAVAAAAVKSDAVPTLCEVTYMGQHFLKTWKDTKNGTNYPTEIAVLDACKRRMSTLDDPGFCIFCGVEAMECEPDAQEGHCDSCGRPGVYGAEELLMRGWYKEGDSR